MATMMTNPAAARATGEPKKEQTEIEIINATIEEIKSLAIKAGSKLDDIEVRMAQMEALPMIDASPSYKEGKYLYLIFPMINGVRERRYVGSDKEKIREALNSIDRLKRYQEVSAKHNQYLHVVHQAISYLEQARYALKIL